MSSLSIQKRTAIRSKLQRLFEEIRLLKKVSASADRDWRGLQVKAMDGLETLSIESFSYENDEGERVKATKVQGSSLIFDEPALKKALGAKVWNKVTRRVLDTAKLEDAIAEGRVDPVTVAECSSEKDSKPYIKITTKAALKDQSKSSSVPERVGRRRGNPRS